VWKVKEKGDEGKVLGGAGQGLEVGCNANEHENEKGRDGAERGRDFVLERGGRKYRLIGAGRRL
jgi:hypothetical protein